LFGILIFYLNFYFKNFMNQISLFMSHNGLLVAGFVLVALIFIANEFSGRFTGIKSLAPEQVVQLINRKDAVVLDIRDLAAFKEGHIVGAVNAPRENFPQVIAQKLERYKTKPVVVCCAVGQNSGKIAGLLLKDGFAEVGYLRGGLAAWRTASLPVTKKG
jgi:rhodanese-related sulfurtransferase